MKTEVKMAQLSMATSGGVIKKWFASEGEKIVKGEPLCEIATAKMTITMEAPLSGTMDKICCQPEESAEVGDVICIIEE